LIYELDYRYKYNGKELQDELGLNVYAYGWRDYDPSLGRWNVIDQLSEKYYKISPYAYVANNPITTIDPDGRYLFGLFGSTSAERKEARAEKYAAKVGGSVVKGENGQVTVNVVNETKDGIISKSNFGDFATLKSNFKSWTNNHKEQLLKGAELAQKKGNQLALTGLGAAAIGAPIGGVGATPGLMVATTGKAINELGVIVEVTTKMITGDKNAVGDSVNYIGGKVVGAVLDNALPGSSSLMSKSVNDAVKVGNKAVETMAEDKTENITDKLREN